MVRRVSEVPLDPNMTPEVRDFLDGLARRSAGLTADGAQPAFHTTGILTQTGTDTFAGRTITGTASQITVSNGNGVSGNPTLSLASNIVQTSGTWTPAIFGSTTSGTQTYAVQSGFYVKFGELCFVSCSVSMSALDGATAGDIFIGDLPFTASATGGVYQQALAISSFDFIFLNLGYTQLTALIAASTKTIGLMENGSFPVGSQPVVESALANNSAVSLSGVYQIA